MNWIDITERYPQQGVNVLAYDGKDIFTAYCAEIDSDVFWFIHPNVGWIPDKVICWKPLTEEPMTKLPENINKAIEDFASAVAGVSAITLLSTQVDITEEDAKKELLELSVANSSLRKAILDAINVAK